MGAAAVGISLTGDYVWWTTAVGTTYACGGGGDQAPELRARIAFGMRARRCCHGIRESLKSLGNLRLFVEGGSRLRYETILSKTGEKVGNTSPVCRRAPYRSEARNHSEVVVRLKPQARDGGTWVGTEYRGKDMDTSGAAGAIGVKFLFSITVARLARLGHEIVGWCKTLTNGVASLATRSSSRAAGIGEDERSRRKCNVRAADVMKGGGRGWEG
ncbi:hypothetical protein BC629DRAFT_1645558 [Irpex lacteus]|nr:hypothetical protein BC629DRAFT_1645558 [Irpex lacteus]